MLLNIELKNYRCFENATLTFKELTIIVGSNNAGKSTIIEALRVVAHVANKYNTANYLTVPKKLSLNNISKGIKVQHNMLNLDLQTVVYMYKEDERAEIIATYENGSKIIVNLDQYEAFAFIINQSNTIVNSRREASRVGIEQINIMPQLGLIKGKEKVLSHDTITNHLETYRSSMHFRNELYEYSGEKFIKFKKLAEETWEGLKIDNIILNESQDEPTLSLLVREHLFTGEIGLMGSGIQMWLQIIWFICKSNDNSIIILDEPDVYMHPDLQLKILKIVKKLFDQVIIATHSIEIISEVSPKNIVIVDKKRRNKNMQYAGENKIIQNIIDDLGSVQNISLIRLGSKRKCIFVEGNDLKIIKKFHKILYPEDNFALDSLPCISLNGWARFEETIGAAKLLYAETKGIVKVICILDRDAHLDEELIKYKTMAEENHINLHIWEKKEIENYIMAPEVLFRVTGLHISKYETFLKDIENELELLKEKTIERFTSSFSNIQERDKRNPYKATKAATEYVNQKWTTLENKLALVHGKEAKKLIINWIKETYNKPCTVQIILDAFKKEDISLEMKEVIDMLCE